MRCFKHVHSAVGCGGELISVVVLVLVHISGVSSAVGDYTHEWAVQIEGGDHVAQAVAFEQNFDIVDKVFHDVYVFKHRRLARRSIRPSVHHHRALHKHPKVQWAQQQKVLRRTKRDYQQLQDLHAQYPGLKYRQDHDFLPTHPTILDDPQWPHMWYLNRGSGLDMRVQEAWAEGVTGKGVVATILDDGLEKGHPDIIKNYDPDASYDVNNRDHDPVPRYDLIDTNRHGTRCAGEVAASANNSICAVGVAYEASIGGVRMLDGDVTDSVEARSLALNPQHIDIYSASWGPDDDGRTVDGPGELATRAFIEGINNGRNGLGSIFIWASGNGGTAQDNCNCDGYTNAIWTLSISSATERGNVPWYSEACSSTLATTYSSGSTGERKIITTDLHHECTTSHTGTSASAPLAAGVVALALAVNRNITWRDMQHIVVRTARPENLDTNDWQTNGVGRKVSHRFGYGLMDAYAMVQLARNWINVAPQRSCEVQAPHDDKLIPQKSYVSLQLEVSDCPGVEHLEHVQAMVSLSADRRGDLEIYLISPAGTKSTLLAQRPRDESSSGFHSWPFMSVHMWGEKPLGVWTLEIHNNGHYYITTSSGDMRTSRDKVEMKDFTLVLHGTEVEPGQPAPNYNGRYPSSMNSNSNNHLSSQDRSHSTTGEGTKDSNTQRHNPVFAGGMDDGSIHSGRDDTVHRHQDTSSKYQDATVYDGNIQSSASRPSSGIPLKMMQTLMTDGPSVKKAGVDDVPVPVLITEPSQQPLPPYCSTIDDNTSACLECTPGYVRHSGGCVKNCPDNYYRATTSINISGGTVSANGSAESRSAANHRTDEQLKRVVITCVRCHYTCKACVGVDASQCTACWSDATLELQPQGSSGECCVTSLLQAYTGIHQWAPTTILLLLISSGLFLFVVLVVLYWQYYSVKHPVPSANSIIRDISNGVRNGVKNGLHSTGTSKKNSTVCREYRKLSDDTEKLVTSSRPFYDYSSDDEDEIV
uniref:furin n=1 Tax=Hirondellea gigas TaxID=1518452 RepID=A0A2P2I1L6_9CRUS